MTTPAPVETREVYAQLQLLHLLADRIGDDVNDAWCEEGGSWPPEYIEWATRVDAYLHEVAPKLSELMLAFRKLEER